MHQHWAMIFLFWSFCESCFFTYIILLLLLQDFIYKTLSSYVNRNLLFQFAYYFCCFCYFCKLGVPKTTSTCHYQLKFNRFYYLLTFDLFNQLILTLILLLCILFHTNKKYKQQKQLFQLCSVCSGIRNFRVVGNFLWPLIQEVYSDIW